ncbi:MAG: MFS transporter [Saccharofermentanales bacterium]
MKKRFNKQERSWILYDWANSVHSTIIVAAIFPIYFATVAANAGEKGDVWIAWGAAATTLLMAILAPIVGAIGDYKGMKKKLFSTFLLIGLVFTSIMAFTDNWALMLIGYAISYLGFSGANLFYDSFLTDVTTADRMDKVSAWGFSMGYIGGSTIPFLIAIGLVMFGGTLFPALRLIDATLPAEEIKSLAGVMAVKASIIITVLWWGIFSIPILRNVHQIHYVETPATKLVKTTFISIGMTVKHIFHDKALLVFIIAYFFYIDGVNSVIHMATAYGSSLGLDSTGMILALLVTQIVAVPCAIWFSKFAGKIGSINMIAIGIGIYFFICILGFIMGFGLEEKFLTVGQAQGMFWFLAILVGTSQGGIQALSRSFFGKLIPANRSNEFFGFFDIFGKFAAVIGPALYAVSATITGRSSIGILSIILLFAIGGIFIMTSRETLRTAEVRALKSVNDAKEKNI